MTVTRPLLLLLLLLPLSLGTACGGDPPAPPFVDPVHTPTSLTQQDITGYARFGATVTVEGGAATATTKADPYVGKFRVTVMLNPMTTNTLSVTAKDEDGTSKPTVVQIVTPAPAARVALALGAPTMKAGAAVTATVTVYDTDGAPTGMLIAPTVTGPTGAGAVTVSGMGTAADPFKLSGTLAGEYTVTATLAPDQVATATLTVVPADATMAPDLHLRLASDPHGADVTNVSAGAALVYRYSVADMYGNQIPQPTVVVSTTMPGAVVGPVDTQETDASGNVVYQGSILSFVRAGTYAVSAHLAGTTLTQAATVIVGTDPSALVARLTLSSNIAPLGTALSYQVTVVDAFGNVDAAALARLSLVTSPTPATAPTCSPNPCATAAASGTITFASAGSFQLAATFAGAPAVVGDARFVSVINAPVPPTFTLYSPTSADVYAPGDTINLTLQAHTANAAGGTATYVATGAFGRSGSQTIGQDVCAAGPVGCAPLVSFTVPTGTTFGAETLLVTVSDALTGAAITQSVTFTIDPTRRILAAGRTVTLVARGGRLDVPMGVAVFGSDLYVANNGASEVLKLGLGGALPVTPVLANVFSAGVQGASDVQLRPDPTAPGVYPPATFQGLYVGNDAGRALRTTDATGVSSTFGTVTDLTTTAYQGTPVPAGSGNTSRLFAANPNNQTIRVLDPTTGADLVPGGQGLPLNLNTPWGVTFYATATSTRVVAGDFGNSRVRSCDLGTGAPSTWGTSCAATNRTIASGFGGGTATLRSPRGLAMSATGKLYVVSQTGTNRGVVAYDPNAAACTALGGCPETVIATGFDTPSGLAFDPAGNLYVSDEALGAIVRIAPGATPF